MYFSHTYTQSIFQKTILKRCKKFNYLLLKKYIIGCCLLNKLQFFYVVKFSKNSQVVGLGLENILLILIFLLREAVVP